VQSPHKDGGEDVPHVITQASHKDYMSKKPAREQMKLKLTK
jgi:hypothetical protein